MQTELFQHVRQGIAVADAQRVDAAAGNDEVVFHGDVLDLAPAETTAQGIDDIRRMVGRADELGLELIPVVSNLGHTQRFLRHPELLHLAELRGGIAGRFTPAGKPYYIDVCPSLEETYTFFDRYITEAA